MQVSSCANGPRYCCGTISACSDGSTSQMPAQAGRMTAMVIAMLSAIRRLPCSCPSRSCAATASWNKSTSSVEPIACTALVPMSKASENWPVSEKP